MEGGACGRATWTRRHHSADSGGAIVASRVRHATYCCRRVYPRCLRSVADVTLESRRQHACSVGADFSFRDGAGRGFPDNYRQWVIGQIRRERMGFAASLFGMMVSAGAATGIALVTNALTARHQLHQASLYAHLPLLKASKGVAVSTGMLGSQAWLLAYNDVYEALAALLLFLTAWCMLLRRSSEGETEALVE